jgi:hypothetical protein
MRPPDGAGSRQAWDVVERPRDRTIERAGRLDPNLLHESIDGEWSFIETLKHLVLVTYGCIRRAVRGDPSPWHRFGLPRDDRTRRGVARRMPRDRPPTRCSNAGGLC